MHMYLYEHLRRLSLYTLAMIAIDYIYMDNKRCKIVLYILISPFLKLCKYNLSILEFLKNSFLIVNFFLGRI